MLAISVGFGHKGWCNKISLFNNRGVLGEIPTLLDSSCPGFIYGASKTFSVLKDVFSLSKH